MYIPLINKVSEWEPTSMPHDLEFTAACCLLRCAGFCEHSVPVEPKFWNIHRSRTGEDLQGSL